jgi:hypothetical protein
LSNILQKKHCIDKGIEQLRSIKKNGNTVIMGCNGIQKLNKIDNAEEGGDSTVKFHIEIYERFLFWHK